MDFTSITSHIHNQTLFSLWFHLFILSAFISPLLPSSILGTYKPEEFIFQCPIFFAFSQVITSHAVWGQPRWMGHGGSSDKTWSPGEGNGKPLQHSCLENPTNTYLGI